MEYIKTRISEILNIINILEEKYAYTLDNLNSILEAELKLNNIKSELLGYYRILALYTKNLIEYKEDEK